MNNGRGIGPRRLCAPKSMAKQVTDPKKGKNFSQKAAYAQQRALEKEMSKENKESEFSSKAVADAKAEKGAYGGTKYKSFGGKEIKSGGKTTGFKSHDGSFTRVTNPSQLAEAKKAFEKEKTVYNKKLEASKAMRKRTATSKDPKKG